MKGCRAAVEDAGASSTVLLAGHIPGLRRFALALLRGDRDRADDLVQDSLERVLAHWDRRRPDGNLRNWLYTILYNRLLTDTRRRLKREAWLSSLAVISEEDFPAIDGGQN